MFTGSAATLLINGIAYSCLSFGVSIPGQAEVRYLDGSLVRMSIEQPAIELQTKYGMLKIPVADIKRIEAGVPLAQQAKIVARIRDLGSAAFKERDDASKWLVDAGPAAWAVLRVHKATDQESAKRIADAMRRLEEVLPSDHQRRALVDTVHAVDFTAVGSIVGPTLKARSVHFGEVNLDLAAIQSIVVRTQESLEMTLDAAKHGLDSDKWFDTGLTLDDDSRLTITADGHVDLWPQGMGQFSCGPNGHAHNQNGKGSSYTGGKLVGRVGDGSSGLPTYFPIGDRWTGTRPATGRLFLQIVSSPWNVQSLGSYRVRIQVNVR